MRLLVCNSSGRYINSVYVHLIDEEIEFRQVNNLPRLIQTVTGRMPKVNPVYFDYPVLSRTPPCHTKGRIPRVAE